MKFKIRRKSSNNFKKIKARIIYFHFIFSPNFAVFVSFVYFYFFEVDSLLIVINIYKSK